MSDSRQQTLEALRQAIQDAEEYGLVRDESGQAITGAVDSDHGFILTKEGGVNDPSK